jgi:hypothetical protein
MIAEGESTHKIEINFSILVAKYKLTFHMEEGSGCSSACNIRYLTGVFSRVTWRDVNHFVVCSCLSECFVMAEHPCVCR